LLRVLGGGSSSRSGGSSSTGGFLCVQGMCVFVEVNHYYCFFVKEEERKFNESSYLHWIIIMIIIKHNLYSSMMFVESKN
jgi:hypothetical protein